MKSHRQQQTSSSVSAKGFVFAARCPRLLDGLFQGHPLVARQLDVATVIVLDVDLARRVEVDGRATALNTAQRNNALFHRSRGSIHDTSYLHITGTIAMCLFST